MFIPSPQQQTIFDTVLSTRDSIMVGAVAGSGKSTTLVELTKLLPRDCIIVSLAFNKSITLALANRLPYWVQNKTFHSHCYSALRLYLPVAPKPPKPDKTKQILLDLVGDDRGELFLYLNFVSKLVSLAKSLPTNSPPWRDLVDYHELLCEGDEETGIAYANDAFILSASDHQTIDFDDMLWQTWQLNAPFQQADYLLVDEVQDLNAIQHALLPRMVKPNGRLVLVGDSSQAIYAFRGADSNSMAKLSQQFNCRELPLSVSYRCSKAVVLEAQIALQNNLI